MADAETMLGSLVAAAAPSPLALVGADRKIIFANDAFRDWFDAESGQSIEAAVGQTVFAQIGPFLESVTPFGADPQQPTYRDVVLPRAEGRAVLHAQVTLTPVGDGSTFILQMTDITARRQAEDKLRLAMGSARCLLWYAVVWEIGQPWLKWDFHLYDEDTAQQFFPLHTELPDLPYTYAWYLSRLPEDRERMERYGREKVRAGENYSQEFRCRGQDGRLHWFKEDVRVTTTGPDSWWVVGVCTDITDLRRAEESLREAEARRRGFIREVLYGVTQGRLRLCESPDDLPPRLSACDEPIEVEARVLSQVRGAVRRAATGQGHPEERVYDLISAVGEASMNAVVHGGGQGIARICAGDGDAPDAAGTVQIWIEDQGKGIAVDTLHRATLERGFTTAGTLGHGFWIILKTVDRVWLLTRPEGTTVVLEQDRVHHDEEWQADDLR